MGGAVDPPVLPKLPRLTKQRKANDARVAFAGLNGQLGRAGQSSRTTRTRRPLRGIVSQCQWHTRCQATSRSDCPGHLALSEPAAGPGPAGRGPGGGRLLASERNWRWQLGLRPLAGHGAPLVANGDSEPQPPGD
jgi:hypothetical protein